MKLILLLIAALPLYAQHRTPFSVSQSAEVIAEIELSSPGSDWAIRGKEAAVAVLKVDDRPPQHIFVHSERALVYPVFLGALDAGKHQLQIVFASEHSAPNSKLEIGKVHIREISSAHPEYAVVAHAPVLFIRKNTIGKFSDIPLLAYCERLDENGQPVLLYTVVFSNEDGGTSTRALMARWGRTTDIEYVYRAYLGADGKVNRQIVQGPNHKDIEFQGAREGTHPLLMPVTDNNMIGEGADSPLRFQILPKLVDLTTTAREQVMDDQPVTYSIMVKELEREGKLRPFGAHDRQKISTPRNYAFFEYAALLKGSALSVAIHLKNGRAYSSDVGRPDYAISRSGWVRTTVELPPGTSFGDISGIEFRCAVHPESLGKVASGSCDLERVSKAFFLDENYVPSAPFWSMKTPVSLLTGVSAVFKP